MVITTTEHYIMNVQIHVITSKYLIGQFVSSVIGELLGIYRTSPLVNGHKMQFSSIVCECMNSIVVTGQLSDICRAFRKNIQRQLGGNRV